MITFPKSRVDAFRHNDKSKRWGQSFYDYMKLDKCEQDRIFCDELYNASDAVAKAMVRSRLDENN